MFLLVVACGLEMNYELMAVPLTFSGILRLHKIFFIAKQVKVLVKVNALIAVDDFLTLLKSLSKVSVVIESFVVRYPVDLQKNCVVS